MLRKLLIVAGALSVVSISAQADERQILNGPTTIGSVTGVVTEYATLDDMYGGAINNPSGYNLTISANSSISDNKLIQTDPKIGVYGGAIAQQDGNLSIGSNVTFSNNIVTGGSQIYENWDGTDSASGGAIYINGNYTVTTSATGKVIFTDNHAYAAGEGGESNGGAIFAGGSPNGASITFHDVEFSNNSSVTRGGAIYNGETDIKIEGQGTFSGNTSKTGGAVYNYDNTGYTKFSSGTNTTFTENKATGNGGAIANFDGVVNIGKGNSFSGNEAEGKGGAIYNANFAKTSVTNISGGTTFTENKAGTSGGAIHTSGTTKIDTTDGNVLFYDNEATLGADLYLDGTSSELRVTGNNANYKVSFGSKNSIAGEGNIIHESKGTFELKGNSDFSDFTGNYTQTSGKTLLNNSTIFDKFDIKGGELELINGSVATIDNDGKNFSGSAITITSSTLDLTTSIADAVKVNVNTGGILNLSNNSTLTITKGNDNWTGTINVGSNGRATDDSALIVNGYNGVVTYTQKSGSLTLQNSADITLEDANSSISAGDVNVNGNSTLTIKDGATINGSANTTAQSGSTVNVNNGTLGDSNSTGKIDLKQGSNLNITNNGSVTIHSNDNLGANIKVGTAGSTTDNSTLVLDEYNGSINYKQNSGSLTLQNSADVTLKDQNSSISAGNVNVNGNSTLTVKDGATINGSANTTAQSGSTVNVNKGILGDSNSTGKIDLQQGSTLNITNNGSVTIHSNDNLGANIKVGTAGSTTDNSTLVLDEYNGSINYKQNSGSLTLQNSADITLEDANSSISAGNVNVNGNSTLTVKDGATINGSANTTAQSGSTVNVNKGILGDSNSTGKIDLQQGSTLNITNNGSVTIHSNDNLGANINLGTAGSTTDNSTLVLDKYNGSINYKQNSGSLTLQNSADVTLKDENSSISAGNVNVNGNSTLTIKDGATINGSANTTAQSGSTVNVNNGTLGDSNSTGKIDLQQGSTLNITNNGNVTLNSKDNWAGTINLGTEGDTDDSSTLTVNFDEANTGELHAETGNLIITNQNFTVGENSYIYKEVNIQTSGTININGGFVAIDDLDSLEEGATLTLDGGTLEYYKNGANAFVSAIKGKLDLMDGSSLTISGNTENSSSIASDVELTINKEARLTLENTVLNLDEKDAWLGHITNESGTINANGVRNASGSLGQADGELNLDNSNIILNSESSITGGDIRIENNSTLTIVDAELINTNKTNMTIDADSTFNVSSSNSEFSLNELNASAITNPDGSIKQASLINVMNDQLNRATINNLGINTQANFNVDILGRSSLRNDSDKFTIGKLTDSGTIKIDDWKFYGDVYGYDAPVDRHVKLGDIFILDNDENGKPIEASIETTDKTNFSPIGWYQLNKGAGARGYTLDLVKYNPQVFRGQVATVSQWMNQLAIEDMLFTHSMVLPSFKEEDGGKMANNYASADALFAPYQYSRKDGGLWVKTYGTFEHLQMSNGLKHVGNNSYGTLIGADLGLKDLKNGWKFMPTAYVGYNGAHQYWSNVSQYQNGGQAGFLGTWYKDNFILGAMAYGGLYGNTMDVYGHTDETFNYFAGTAAKASYNVRVHRDFVIQPNLLASYNYFGQQNWHSNFGQMGMMSGMLHGVNIAPGVNFIWERDTFSAYLTLQYMYNVNGASGGRAGNVDLPNLVMQRGYIQYGIGFTKKFTDRASGYFQAVLRNAGRTGVGLQAGFLYRIGK